VVLVVAVDAAVSAVVVVPSVSCTFLTMMVEMPPPWITKS
jgi:hypothetical protein